VLTPSPRAEWQPPKPVAFEAILARLRAKDARYFNGPADRLEILERIERPFSELVRVRAQCGRQTTCVFVTRLKPKAPTEEQWLLSRDRVRRDYAASLRVLQSVKGRTEFSAVRPIGCFPEDLVLITEELPGQTLSVVLERSARWVPKSADLAYLVSIFERIGAWVKVFQGNESASGAFSLSAMREYLDVRLRKIVASRNDRFSEADQQRLLTWFDSCAANVSGSELLEVPVHADLCPANILIHEGTIAAIDFAMASTGGAYLDVSRMFTQLEFLKAKPRFRPAVIVTLQAALLRGFDPDLRPDRPLFRLFVLQHTITQFLKLTLRPGRSTARLWSWHQRRRHRRSLNALISQGYNQEAVAAGRGTLPR
jgi:hypothetical protein